MMFISPHQTTSKNIALILSTAGIAISLFTLFSRGYEHLDSPVFEERQTTVERVDYSSKSSNRSYILNGLTIPRAVFEHCASHDQTWEKLKQLEGKPITLRLNTQRYDEILSIKDPVTGGDFHLCP